MIFVIIICLQAHPWALTEAMVLPQVVVMAETETTARLLATSSVAALLDSMTGMMPLPFLRHNTATIAFATRDLPDLATVDTMTAEISLEDRTLNFPFRRLRLRHSTRIRINMADRPDRVAAVVVPHHLRSRGELPTIKVAEALADLETILIPLSDQGRHRQLHL